MRTLAALPKPRYHDVTPHQLAEYADAFRSVFERSGTCMAVLDNALRIQEANPQFLGELPLGDAAVGRNLLELVRDNGQAHLRRQFGRLVEGRCDRLVERITLMRADERGSTGVLTAVTVQGHVPVVSAIVVSIDWDDEREDDGLDRKRRRLLTELDARIMEGIANGMSTVSMATRLHLSRQGVEYHVGIMLKKLKAPNRAALVSRAYAMGLLDPSAWPPKVDPAFVK